jgi:hypothetical protein
MHTLAEIAHGLVERLRSVYVLQRATKIADFLQGAVVLSVDDPL